MPPPSSQSSLRRVLHISAIDGWSVAIVAGLCTLGSLLFTEWIGVGIGSLVTAAGVLELRGRKILLRGNASGMNQLILSQIIILFTISIYALRSLLVFDQAAFLASITPKLRGLISQLGVPMDIFEQILRPAYVTTYLIVIVLTVLFQGGMALYYRSQRARITEALSSRPSQPPPLPGI